MVYDSLLSPTIMVLRRPRREEGGRGHGQQEGRGRALAGRGLPAVHVRGLLPRQGRPQNQMIEGAKKGIISLLSGQTCPASPASPSSWSKRTLSRKLLCYLILIRRVHEYSAYKFREIADHDVNLHEDTGLKRGTRAVWPDNNE